MSQIAISATTRATHTIHGTDVCVMSRAAPAETMTMAKIMAISHVNRVDKAAPPYGIE